MDFLIPILVVAVLIIAISSIGGYIAVNYKYSGSAKSIKKSKSKEEAIEEATRRLAKNTKDAVALNFLGDVYYQAQDWEKAYHTYEALSELPPVNGELSHVQANLRAGIAAMRLNNFEAAHKFFVIARSLDQSSPEVNYQFGNLEFMRGNYEKSVKMLKMAITRNPEHSGSLRIMGHALFKLKRSKEAMGYIRKAMEADPGDKESLITLAECYADAGQKEQALRIYSHLRPDEIWGAQACLESGMIHIEAHRNEEAISDFEIGLKHQTIEEDIEVELKYQLASVYLRQQDTVTAMKYLQQIKEIRDSYKNVEELINNNKELVANKNLRIFTMASSADFIALCRKVTMTYFSNSKVKIIKTKMNGNDWTDIVAEVDTPKWSSIVMFRFIRIQGVIGELVLRDFHSHLKDEKADKGICAGVGDYSEEARKFTEARLIDLIEKERLKSILNNVDAKMQAIADSRKARRT
ncbi:MAG: tetratricopeptide repeat protein [Spirochaetaceae bacterium]|jgi:tetratricopeptide (TPR) repeat protein|nr:tetratricopeptide repeat protein [Spirochaetaceae bacterium]